MSEHLPNIHYLEPEILQRLDDLELIAREAVDYAMRHHDPSEISIGIMAANKGGVLVVKDDGQGGQQVDHEDVSQVLMRTHATLIDAQLEAVHARAGGNEQTCIFLAIAP